MSKAVKTNVLRHLDRERIPHETREYPVEEWNFDGKLVAEKLGLEAYGVPALDVNYRGQAYREFREMLARSKDFCTAVIQPQPKFLGEKIPISGNGDLTND